MQRDDRGGDGGVDDGTTKGPTASGFTGGMEGSGAAGSLAGGPDSVDDAHGASTGVTGLGGAGAGGGTREGSSNAGVTDAFDGPPTTSMGGNPNIAEAASRGGTPADTHSASSDEAHG
ncbi:MAG: hypothetical protein NVS2B7_16980 [Herpetosiphon sp.]